VAAYHRVYDSHHLEADAENWDHLRTLRSVIEYGLPSFLVRVRLIPLFKFLVWLVATVKQQFWFSFRFELLTYLPKNLLLAITLLFEEILRF